MNLILILDPDASLYWAMTEKRDVPELDIEAAANPDQLGHIFCDNYPRFISGAPLIHTIDFTRGY